MKYTRMIVSLGIAALAVALAFSGVAGEAPQVNPRPPGEGLRGANPSLPVRLIMYKPPRVSAPAGRVGGGTRGPGDPLPAVLVLAPEHTGLTTQEQPFLYWYLSASTAYPIELTVTDAQAVRPLLETRLPAPSPYGVQQVRLAEYGIHLVPGTQYRWFVAVIPDPDNRSKDVIAGGLIERTDPPAALRAQLAQADAAQTPFIYAEAGIWYDALAAISAQIEATPTDPVPRQQRAALLEQVGLAEVAAHDLQRGR